MLRHPVDRAYSHYLHSVRDEREALPFSDAVKMEKERLKVYCQKEDYMNTLRHSYIAQGQYGKMLNSYLNFFPLENFLFIHFEEDFIKNRKNEYNSRVLLSTLDILLDILKCPFCKKIFKDI